MKLDTFTRIIKDESGATAIEYGLILAFMAGAIIAVFSGLGTQLVALFSGVGESLQVQTPGA